MLDNRPHAATRDRSNPLAMSHTPSTSSFRKIGRVSAVAVAESGDRPKSTDTAIASCMTIAIKPHTESHRGINLERKKIQ